MGLGYHEPLNPAEHIKKDDNGLQRPRPRRPNLRARRVPLDRQAGPAQPPALVGPLHPAHAGRARASGPASAEPEELEDEFFMLRIRIDGGAMTSDQLRAIAWTSPSATDVTSPTSPTARTCNCTGSASRTCPRSGSGSSRWASRPRRRAATRPRVMIGCPVAGVTADEVLDATPVDPRGGGALPGRPRLLQPAAQVQDVDQRLPDRLHEPRDQRHLAGGGRADPRRGPASTCGWAAACRRTRCSRSGWACSCAPERVRRGLGRRRSLFREYGYRRSRNHARFKFLVKDWGAERVREVLEKEFLERPRFPTDPRRVVSADASPRPRRRGSPARRPRLRGPRAPRRPDRRAPAPAGGRPRRPIRRRVRPRHRAAEAGDAGRRPCRVDSWSSTLTTWISRRDPIGSARARWPARASSSASWRSARRRAGRSGSTNELAARLPDFDEDMRIHVNGCPNSCARFQVADIGLMSAPQPRPDGTKSDAFLVHLGGGLGEVGAFGRKVEGREGLSRRTPRTTSRPCWCATSSRRRRGRLVRHLREPPAADEQLARFAGPVTEGAR